MPIALAIVLVGSRAQETTQPVSIAEEPHHHLLLENPYVRVFQFHLSANDSTRLHSHDHPYLTIVFGSAEFVNSISGKQDAKMTMTDGQISYSSGGFAHIVRTETEHPFDNLTVELLRPQREVRNLCQKVVDGPLNDCPSGNVDKLPPDSPMRQIAQAMRITRLFETGEIEVTGFSITFKQNYSETEQFARLLIVEQGSELRLERPGEASKILHGGEIEWLGVGTKWTIATPGDQKGTVSCLFVLRTASAQTSSKPQGRRRG